MQTNENKTNPNDSQRLRVATFNIRYDNPKDGVNAWPNRREWVRDLMDFHDFDLVGVQEALAHQIEYLAQGRFGFVGIGRDDGKRAGEFAPILYDKTRFELLQDGTFWLSETPEKPSRGWDADLNRICTWARLRDRTTARTFFLFNTHFDHRGEVARAQSAELLLTKTEAIAGQEPFFLTGDFNLGPETAPIRRLSAALRNCREVTEVRAYGPVGTFHGFDVQRTPDGPIDYIFVSRPIRVLKYAALPDNWGQRYPSDHLPVAIHASITG
jgi:endonuclease/exonuclease/phosphatase family metal-dependent hydrolase